MRESGQSFETLQRQQRTVDGKPAQLVKLHYVEKASGREWIEELVFVEGPDAEIYSVALKCAPPSLARMEPVFSRIVDSWKLPEAEPPAGTTDQDPPPATAPTSSDSKCQERTTQGFDASKTLDRESSCSRSKPSSG